MQRYEELKKQMLDRVMKEDEVPENVYIIIDNYFQEIESMYERFAGNTTRIPQYIEGKVEELKFYINKEGNIKRDFQVKDMQYIVNKIERDINEEQKEQDEIRIKRQEEKNKDNIKSITINANKLIGKCVQHLEDTVRNIRMASMRMLNDNNFDQRKIEEIDNEIRLYIKDKKSNTENKIYETLQENDKALVDDLIEMYEQYIQEKKIKNDNKVKTDRELFTEPLKSGISLEEQAEFVEEKMKDKEEKTIMSLPDNVIE